MLPGVCRPYILRGPGNRPDQVEIPSEQGLNGVVKVTPAVFNNMIYFGSVDGNLYCISADTGTFQWAYQTRNAIRCPPILDDGTIYLGSDDKSVYAIDAATGEAATGWAKPFTSKDDFANGIAIANGIVVASSMDGVVYGIHEGSGKLKWSPFRMSDAPIRTSPVIEENYRRYGGGQLDVRAVAREAAS